jgi:hypothetical protein
MLTKKQGEYEYGLGFFSYVSRKRSITRFLSQFGIILDKKKKGNK